MPPGRDSAHAIIQSGISVVKYIGFHEERRDNEQDITDAIALLKQQDVLLV